MGSKQHKQHLVLGKILHSYPPFLVRQLIVEGIGDLPPYVPPRPAITMLFRGEEFQITSTYDARDDIPWVIHALRLWLADSPRIIHYWEEHLDILQRPEEMAHLEEDLEAERAAEMHPPDFSVADEPRALITAEQVLANQRDELARIRQLTHEVEQGLKALEAAYPEAVAVLDEVADEIARRRTRLNEG